MDLIRQMLRHGRVFPATDDRPSPTAKDSRRSASRGASGVVYTDSWGLPFAASLRRRTLMRVSALPLPQRLTRAVGESPVSERVAAAQELAYGPILDWARRSPFHTGVLGHSVHPALTDLTLGCWVSSSILDLTGEAGSRRGATLLVGAGLVAAVPTAIAGAGDWAEMSGAPRRIGAVHALGTDVAIFLFLGSLIARMRGRHSLGKTLSLVGNVIVAGAGFLGGHLALSRGTARRSDATNHGL